MKKNFIILILIITVSINIAGAKLVFTDKKTFTYNKTDEKYMKYIKYEDQAVSYDDAIGITDGTIEFRNLKTFTGYSTKPRLWVYNGWENNSNVKGNDYGNHLIEVYRAFSLGAGGKEKYEKLLYSTVLIAEAPILPKGILSSSYMIQDDYRHYLGKNSIYFGNILNELAIGGVVSPRFYSEEITKNDYLILHSLGNPISMTERELIVKNSGDTFINIIFPTFETMHFGMFGEEVQKLMRAEKIRVGQYACSSTEYSDSVKNITSLITGSMKKGFKTDTSAGIGQPIDNIGKKYLRCVLPIGKTDVAIYPLYSRGNTIYDNGQVMRMEEGHDEKMDDGTILENIRIVSGTSYSSPRLAGGVKQLSEYFPGITYHQLKQFIFTTASRAEDNLDNILGWGIADIGKAKKGPSAFNAGLIEEQKFFTGMYDKIKGSDGRPFFWAEIPEKSKWEWYNNIQGSMNQKPEGKSCYNMLVDTINPETGYTYAVAEKNALIENMCVQNYLPSEKNFYRNVKDIETLAGLRKAGKGVLDIYGKLRIDGPVQLLEGEINIYNDVYTYIEAYENTVLILNSHLLSDMNQKINIEGIKALGGKIILEGNINIKEVYFENIEKNMIKVNGRVVIDKVYVRNEEQIRKLKKILNNDSIEIKNYAIHNIRFEDILINTDKTMGIPREYFMSNFGNRITGYSANSDIYDKLVKKYGRMDQMPENIKQNVSGYSNGIFRLDIDSDTDPFNKEDFVNGTGNYVKNAEQTVKTLNEKYYFIKQD